MSNYFGQVGKRIEREVVITNTYNFTTHFSYYGESNTIYTMQDEDGNVFVWKTSGSLMIETVDVDGTCKMDIANRYDTVVIKATVKEHKEYKGTPQTVLTRVKTIKIVHAPTKQERDAEKAQQQRDSLTEGDFIWRMPYRQYKEHYADCETVAGSYWSGFSPNGHRISNPVIEVIIRAGRLVPSGVRGKHFSGYEFEASDGGRVTYRAVSEENARKQMLKEFPEGIDWECVKIYR